MSHVASSRIRPTWWEERRAATGGLALLFTLAAPAAHAAWPPSGLPLATGPTFQALPTGITAAGGDLYAFWVDSGSQTHGLYAQRLTLRGTRAAGWPEGGRGVVTTPAAVSAPELAPDGAGGALVAWFDYRSAGGPRGIYAIRVDEEGAVVPGWVPSGTPVCTAFNPEGWGPLNDLVKLCSDRAGGAFVAWTDARNTPPMGTLVYDVYAQHLGADGTPDPSWPAQGLGLVTGSGYKYPHELIADDAGGFWLVSENPLATYKVSVRHHAANGSVIGQWSTPSYASQPDAVSDGAGGLSLTWRDCRDCPGPSDAIYAMRLVAGAAPAPGWPLGGVLVVGTPHTDSVPVIVTTAGAFMVAWLTDPVGSPDSYSTRRLEGNGAFTPGWLGSRTFATSADILSGWPLIVPDGAGGAMFAFRRNLPNLFGSRVDAAGRIPAAFPDTGLSLCTLSGDQFLRSLVSDGLNGAYVLWDDRRDPLGNGDPYVMRFTREGGVGSTTYVSPPPPLPLRLALSAPAPNPATGACTLRLTLPAPVRARVEVLDLSGRRVAVLLDEVADGTRALRWDGRDREGRQQPSGVYLVTARVADDLVSRRIVWLE